MHDPNFRAYQTSVRTDRDPGPEARLPNMASTAVLYCCCGGLSGFLTIVVYTIPKWVLGVSTTTLFPCGPYIPKGS
jgi:hypothetical protein